MEQFLNLVWLAISVSLAISVLASRRNRGTVFTVNRPSTVWLSYLILIAMLLPVISMTDDLTAMVAPTDGEQVTRRYEIAPHATQHHPALQFAILHQTRELNRAMICAGWLEVFPAFCEAPVSIRSLVSGRAPPVIA